LLNQYHTKLEMCAFWLLGGVSQPICIHLIFRNQQFF
jgi:hypothetical protein